MILHIFQAYFQYNKTLNIRVLDILDLKKQKLTNVSAIKICENQHSTLNWILYFQNINNNNNNDKNNRNSNNNKNTNENKKKKRSVLESAAITNDLEIVHKLLQQIISDREMANDIIEDILLRYGK